jgi:hypothetical protein
VEESPTVADGVRSGVLTEDHQPYAEDVQLCARMLLHVKRSMSLKEACVRYFSWDTLGRIMHYPISHEGFIPGILTGCCIPPLPRANLPLSNQPKFRVNCASYCSFFNWQCLHVACCQFHRSLRQRVGSRDHIAQNGLTHCQFIVRNAQLRSLYVVVTSTLQWLYCYAATTNATNPSISWNYNRLTWKPRSCSSYTLLSHPLWGNNGLLFLAVQVLLSA